MKASNKATRGRKLRHVLVGTGLVLGLLSTSPLVYAESKADAYFKEATQYLSKGQGRAAIIQLKNALQQDPGHVESRLLLGAVYLRSGDGPAAEKEFQRAGELGAELKRWQLGLGQALLMQGKYEQVLKQLQPNDKQEAPLQASVLAMRAQAMLAGGDEAGADKAYQEALALDAGNVFARLGRVALLVRERKLDEALLDINAVNKLHPDNTQVLLRKAELHRQLRQLDEAEVAFKRVVELNPANAAARLGLALVYITKQQPDEGLAVIAKLDKQARNSPRANYVASLAAYQKGDLAGAADKLQLVLREAPDQLQAQLLYGVVNYAQGNYQLSEDYLARIHSRLPEEPTVAKLLAASSMKLREARRAIAVLEKLAITRPKDAQLMALLGSAYLMDGDNNKGAEYIGKAVELEPDQALLRTQLAVGKLVAGDTSAAVTELEQAVSLGQDVLQADVLLVLTHIKRGETDKAVEVARRMQERMADSPIPDNIMGLAYMGGRDYANARQAFEAALAKDPKFVVAEMNLARLAMAENKPEQAAEHYQAVLAKQPDSLAAMMGLAALARSNGDKAGMEKWIDKAYETAPNALQVVLMKAEILLRQNEALKATTLLNGLSEEQQKQPQVLRLRGLASIQSGQFSNAVHSLLQLTETSPKYIEGWFQLGRAQTAIGDLESARESFGRALALDPERKLPLLMRAMAELELKSKHWDEALKYAQQLQEKNSKDPSGYELEAAAYRGKGQFDNALNSLEKAVRAEGTSQRVNLLAHSLAAAGKGEKATYMLQDWLHDHPDDVVSRSTLGLLLQQAGKVDEAIATYQKVLESGEPNPVIFNNLAWLYLKQSDKRAEEFARKAYEIAPERAEIVDTYGWVQFKLGSKEQGLSLLQQALLLAPRNAEIGLHVAQALHGLGRDGEALPLVERIIKDYPNTQWSLPAKELRDKLKG